MNSGRQHPPRNGLQASAFEQRINAVGEALKPLVPFVLQATVTMGAYAAGLAMAQAAGMAFKVSCATPVLGPAAGLLGVGFASALAGQAGARWRAAFEPGSIARPATAFRTETLLVDAALGVVLFKVMGGRFRSVMPSDLTRVGAIAVESMPTRGVEYASASNRRELLRFFQRDGCHHCGTRKGIVIGDHMPPNKAVQDSMARVPHFLQNLRSNRLVREVADGLGLHLGHIPQRYYPQCQLCSQKQAAAVKMGRSHLVFHQILHNGGRSSAWHWAGVLVGMRHHHTAAAPGRLDNRWLGARR